MAEAWAENMADWVVVTVEVARAEAMEEEAHSGVAGAADREMVEVEVMLVANRRVQIAATVWISQHLLGIM